MYTSSFASSLLISCGSHAFTASAQPDWAISCTYLQERADCLQGRADYLQGRADYLQGRAISCTAFAFSFNFFCSASRALQVYRNVYLL